MREISSPFGQLSPFGRRADLLNATAIARLLFSDNEPGFFYDFDDWSTLFQDTAGTQPVTAANQGVALALDKRLGSNFDARRNLLNRSEDFADSYWTKGDITVSVGPEPSPAGSAFLVSETALSSPIKSLFPASSVTAGLTYTGSWVLKKATTSAAPNWVRIQFRTAGFGSGLQPRANINLATGELGFVANGTASVADLGGGWYRVSITGTANTTASGAGIALFFLQNTNSDNEFVGYVGDVNASVLAAAPQMEVSSTVTPYQPTTTLPTSWAGNHATQATTAARPRTVIHPDGGVRNEVDGSDTLATQTVAVTAQERTLSFRGTGTVTLSGASTAGPLVGTGADDIVSLTFTPTAGSLTLTVSGTVNDAMLELGPVRTPYQKRVNFLDVTEAGKRSIRRLYFNGTSHFLQTPYDYAKHR
jgi:hypothetical protein